MIQRLASTGLKSLADGAAVLDEVKRILLFLKIHRRACEKTEKLLQKWHVGLYEIEDMHLMEVYQTVESGKGAIVENACEYDVFQVLQPVCVVYFLLDFSVVDFDNFLESRCSGEVASVIGFVIWKVWIV